MFWRATILLAGSLAGLAACSTGSSPPADEVFEPTKVIDLGALVTEDLAEQVWGKAALEAFGFTRPNVFDVVSWDSESNGGRVSGTNAYYTLFNHGGPHVDAPNHVSLGGGVDTYPVEAFSGPLRVFDVSRFPIGQSVPREVFEGSVDAGDVVLIYTGYTPPGSEDAFPENVTLTPAAAEYLAEIPVRAYGTDAQSVAGPGDPSIDIDNEAARAIPIHHAFLSRNIPVYEQLFNVDQLVSEPGSSRLYFVGVPLNIQDGDGMIVRPVVFVY